MDSAHNAARFTEALPALSAHWPEYLNEAACLGLFMVSACLFSILLFHPASAVVGAIPSPFLRRVIIGCAMGLTLVAIVYSPLGRRSGAHMNPAVTLTFFRLGKIAGQDAFFYVLSQPLGAIAGVELVFLFAPNPLRHAAVNFAATFPGATGIKSAFIGEFVIAMIMMTAILNATAHQTLSRFTGIFAGALVATFISLESPYSGMSMNPARTIGSAVFAQAWHGIWIYFVAPPLAMLLAAELHLLRGGRLACAKLDHSADVRCIFCEFQQWRSRQPKNAPQELRTIAASGSQN